MSDLIRITTTWQFQASGSCAKAVETLSLAEGVPRVESRACSFEVRGADLAVSFDDGGQATLHFDFKGFSRNRLILDGIRFERIG